MLEKFKQRKGISPDRYPDPEPSGHPEAGGGVMASWWVTLTGAVLALVGAAAAAWGLFIFSGALSPDNATNALREIGIIMGVGVTLLGGLPFLCGVAMMAISVQRRHTSFPKRRHAREG